MMEETPAEFTKRIGDVNRAFKNRNEIESEPCKHRWFFRQFPSNWYRCVDCGWKAGLHLTPKEEANGK